jgi:hypothetical protein
MAAVLLGAWTNIVKLTLEWIRRMWNRSEFKTYLDRIRQAKHT